MKLIIACIFLFFYLVICMLNHLVSQIRNPVPAEQKIFGPFTKGLLIADFFLLVWYIFIIIGGAYFFLFLGESTFSYIIFFIVFILGFIIYALLVDIIDRRSDMKFRLLTYGIIFVAMFGLIVIYFFELDHLQIPFRILFCVCFVVTMRLYRKFNK